MNIEQLKNQAEYAYEQAVAKKNLHQRMQARLNVSFNNGFFTATKENITFLNLFGNNEIVILDDYDTPIKVVATELCSKMKARYYEIMNEWAEEYDALKRVRTAKDV